MNKKLQRLGIFMVVCYLAVFAKLHQTQLIEVQQLAEQPDNQRQVQRKLNKPRGKILSADGVLLAESRAVPGGGNMTPRTRLYPEADLFGQITGYYSGRYGTEGVEKFYDNQLTGDTLRQQVDGLANLFAGTEYVGHVSLTVRKDLQELARQQLGDREGAVTVLDPRSGAILAMYSNPSYNPGLLTENGDKAAQEAYALLNANPSNPMLSKAFRERYNPGSTFKPITAAVGLQTGKVTLDTTYPMLATIEFPDFKGSFKNFTAQPCGGQLPLIMTVSCNTAFMRMGADIGLPALAEGAKSFGYLQNVPIDLPNATQSVLNTDLRQIGISGTAQTAIGQQSNAATPLQIAMAAAAVANNGTIMRPHVMAGIRNQDATQVEKFAPVAWLSPLTPDKAQILRQVMLGPVNDPQGSAYGRISLPPGMIAGGKTGTAQTGDATNSLHTWFMGFAGPQGQPPTVAISVVVLRQRNSGEATGGQVAAPIANVMLNKALAVADLDPADPRNVIVAPTSSVPPPGPFGTTTTTR